MLTRKNGPEYDQIKLHSGAPSFSSKHKVSKGFDDFDLDNAKNAGQSSSGGGDICFAALATPKAISAVV